MVAENIVNDKPYSRIFDKAIIVFLFLFIFCSTFSIACEQIAYFIALIFWLGKMVYEKKSSLESTPFDYYFLAFLGTEIISMILSDDRMQALFYFHKRLVILPIIYLLGCWLKNHDRLELGLKVFVASAFLISLVGIFDITTNLHAYLHFGRRVNLFQFYMTAGGILMIAALMISSLVFHQNTPKKLKITAAIFLIPVLISLLFTFTRGSWLGFLAGSAVISFSRSKKIFIVLMLLVILIIMLAPPEFEDRIFSIVNPSHPANVERVQMWKTGWKIFLDYPVFGIGDIGIEDSYLKYGPPGAEPAGHLHNNYITWLVKLGIVGLVIVLTMFIKIFTFEWKTARKNKENWLVNSIALGAASALIGFSVNGLVEWNFGDTEVIMFLWVTVGFALAASNVGGKTARLT
jgi:O-antigen ligase